MHMLFFFFLVQNEINTLSAYGALTKKLLAVSTSVCLCGLNKAVHNAVMKLRVNRMCTHSTNSSCYMELRVKIYMNVI